jgi:hypothetical protein
MKLTAAVVVLVVVATCAGCGVPRPDRPGPAPLHHQPRGPAAVFVRLGCNECHAVSALGVAASADVGPDLTDAYAEVEWRYGMNLESFLANPTGIMRLMLASHLDLSVADRATIVQILRDLYDRRRADEDTRS